MSRLVATPRLYWQAAASGGGPGGQADVEVLLIYPSVYAADVRFVVGFERP